MLATIEIFRDYPWLVPAMFLAVGVSVGLMLEYVVLPIALAVAKRTSWTLDDVILGSLRGLLLVWMVCAGLHFALHSMPIKTTEATVIAVPVQVKAVTDANSAAMAVGRGSEIAAKLDIVHVADSILMVIFIASMTIYAMRVAVAALAMYINKTGKGGQGLTLFTNVTKVLVLIMGVLVILGTFKIDITPILTALGVGGLAVALALQDTLSNLFAGLHVVASRQVKAGDYVKLDSGDEGYITDITWRNTTIKALANNMIIVPNSKLASAIITNFYKPDREIGMGFNFCVKYNSDLEKVERVALEAAQEVLSRVPGVVEKSEPAVRFGGFGDLGVNAAIGFRVKEFTDQYLIKHELAKALQARFRKEGIEMASPLVAMPVKG